MSQPGVSTVLRGGGGTTGNAEESSNPQTMLGTATLSTPKNPIPLTLTTLTEDNDLNPNKQSISVANKRYHEHQLSLKKISNTAPDDSYGAISPYEPSPIWRGMLSNRMMT